MHLHTSSPQTKLEHKQRLKTKLGWLICIGLGWVPGRAVWYWMLAWTPAFLKFSSAMYIIFWGAPVQFHWGHLFSSALQNRWWQISKSHQHIWWDCLGMWKVHCPLWSSWLLLLSFPHTSHWKYIEFKSELIRCYTWKLPVVGANSWCVKSFWQSLDLLIPS